MVPLADASADPDVIFRLAGDSARSNPPRISCVLGRALARIEWPGVGCFEMKNGREVRIEPAPRVSETTLRAFLLGMMLSVTLYQRGFLVLHASSIALRGADGAWGAVGFLGFSGAGKSTIAAALHARGHRVVSDDVIAVPILAPGQMPFDSQATTYSPSAPRAFPLVYPAYPQLRLWPQSVEALGQDAASLPLLYPQQERRVKRIQQGFEATGVPLRALVVLENGEDLVLKPLSPLPALMQLAQHTYCVELRDPAETAAQFQKCGLLAQTLPVFGLQRPQDLSRLSEAAALVENLVPTLLPGHSETVSA